MERSHYKDSLFHHGAGQVRSEKTGTSDVIVFAAQNCTVEALVVRIFYFGTLR